MPRDIITKVNAALVKVVNTAGMKERFTRQGLNPQTNTPGEFAAFIGSRLDQNAKLIRAIGLRPE